MSEDLGVQLFSVREHLGDELAETLSKIAAIGYTHIEPYDILSDPDALARSLAESGLRAAATHASVQGPRRDDILASAKRLGIGTVIVPWVEPSTFDDPQQVDKLADDINEAAEIAAGHGIRVGYHNHDFEFASGRYRAFTERLSPEIVLELDCFWSSVGGADPLAQVPALGERLRYLHVAAGPPEPGKPPLRGGPIRLPEIIAATRNTVELVVVEVVTERDVWEVLRENYDYFQGVLA
jgi:sugar phosphate isomerase/epimerase